MEPQRNRRADRHRIPTPAEQTAPQAEQDTAGQDAGEPRQPQEGALGQALSSLGKSGGQLLSALASSGGDAVSKLSQKVRDGSLARDFQKNDVLKQGLVYGLPVALFLLGSGLSAPWRLLGLAAACYYLWRYHLGQFRRTRWDYLLLVFPLVFMLENNLPLFRQLGMQVTQMTSGYRGYGISPYQLLGTLAPTLAYNVLIVLFAWMRARTPSLLKAVRVLSLISIPVSLIFGIIQFNIYGGYFGIAFLLYMLSYVVFFAVILYFCAGRQKEQDFTGYQLKNGERWKPAMALTAMYFGVFGVHRTRLGYTKSARVIRWGFISFILGSILLALLLTTRSLGAVQFGVVVFYVCIAYFLVTALWSFVDTFRIILGHLKPAGGSYAPSELTTAAPQQADV